MLDYDFSMHNIVVLVVVILTSPRSSKTKSGCKRYRVSRACCFTFYMAFGFHSEFSEWNPNIRNFPDLFRTDSEVNPFCSLVGFRNIPDHSGPIPDDHENCIMVRSCWPRKRGLLPQRFSNLLSSLTLSLSSIVANLWAWFLSIPPMILAQIYVFKRGDLDLPFYQSHY